MSQYNAYKFNQPNPDEFLGEIKVIAFDFDQTVVDEEFSSRLRWQEVAKHFSYLSEKFEQTLLNIFDTKGHKYPYILNESLQKLNLSDSFIQPVLNYFRKTIANEEKLLGSVTEVLYFLKEKSFRVGIMTDGTSVYQEPRLKCSGIYDMLDFTYYGDDCRKPLPEFFQKCIDDERISSKQFLYVGDHFDKDIKGATTVGSKACWINLDRSVERLPLGTLHFETMHSFYNWLSSWRWLDKKGTVV